jgi:hypothetical protein
MRMTRILPLVFLTVVVSSMHATQKRPSTSKGSLFATADPGNYQADRILPLLLPDGRVVISAVDTVYMLRPNRAVQWKYTTRSGLSGQPAYNAELNEIGVIGYDLVFSRLDAASGREKSFAGVNGGATFTQVVPYARGYLVVVNMSTYREKERLGKQPVTTLDQLDYWDDGVEVNGEGRIAWTVDFPIGADLLVIKSDVFAVKTSKAGVRLIPITVPTKPKQ